MAVDAVQGGTIAGAVKAGAIPLPGVSITASNTLTGKKYSTTTDVNGAYRMVIPKNGRYVVKCELAAFAADTKEVLLNATQHDGQADFAMQLASRVQQQEVRAAAATSQATQRGLQALSVQGGDAGAADASAAPANAAALPTLGGLGDAAASDSVAVTGQMGQTNGLANFNEDEVRQRIDDAMAQARQQGGAQGDMAGAVVTMIGGMMGGGGAFIGGGGGGGGRGARGGGGGNFRAFSPAQIHGAVFYRGGNGALNASDFSLTGNPVIKPAYSNNSYGLSLVGSPQIPGLLKPNLKQFMFLNITGARNINPQNLYATVPTLAERAGDFTGQGVIVDPNAPGRPQFANNMIPSGRLSSAALALLQYYPAPNLTAASAQGYNYQTITSAGTNQTSAALRYQRSFGAAPAGFGGGGGGRAAGGGRNRPAAGAKPVLRQSVNFNGSYTHSASDIRNVFLPLGGGNDTTGYGMTAGYTVGYGRLNNNASINWNRSHSHARNYFTNTAADPSAVAGIVIGTPAVQNNPFFFGVPGLSFNGFSGLNEATPSDRINQTISFSDSIGWSHKKHNMRFGFDIRRIHADNIGGTNVAGSFVFSGYATNNGFADFLLGLPQESAIQAGPSKLYLRGNAYDWFAQDDWRALANLTLNYGLRYEYFSPYVEKNDHLTNLDHNADFTAVAPVLPNAVGPYSGQFPRSLVKPDHTLYSPRFGFAYRPKFPKEMVIRGGYGLNFNTAAYSSFANSLAFQPPFAVTQTNIAFQQGCGQLLLANAFNCSSAATNNYSVNKNYRLGHVQVWNLDVQKTFPRGIVVNVGYNGAKGGELDLVRAPNRTPVGLKNPTIQAFNYEDSLGFSRFNALTVNARKRMQKGISLQATYQYAHSIDNASSIGGSGTVVAQNDADLLAEEGNSSFDVRHKVNGNWVFELPFGPNRAYLAKGGFWSKALDGFSLSGDYTISSGTYFTPHLVASSVEVATGSNNSLRPNRDFSKSIDGPRTLRNWFNTAAFSAPAVGTYGTASRGSIRGPGAVAVSSSLARTFRFGDIKNLETRVSASNVFNMVEYSSIGTTLNTPTFGQVVSTAPMRRLTVQARYRF